MEGRFDSLTIEDFCSKLASKAPVPGGGGASALAGALGVSLANMVGELTVGKQKYSDVEEDIKELMERAVFLEKKFLDLMDEDAEAFSPLVEAYSIPKDEPGRNEIMEKALRKAASVPLEIIETCGEAMEVIDGLAKKGSRIAISDAGCAAALCRSALQAAALNVFVNTKLMKDRGYASGINNETMTMVKKYSAKADAVYEHVRNALI